jgi:cytochrome c oxidase subunit 2
MKIAAHSSVAKIFAFCGIILICAGSSSRSLASGHRADTRTIEVHARRFAFSPAELTVATGESVRLVVISDDVPHSLKVPGLNLNLLATKGHPAETTFTADKVGDFPGVCGRFCGSGHGLMHFTFHIRQHS